LLQGSINMTGITIATAASGIATKQCRQTPNGFAWIDYPHEKWWGFREVLTPSDAAGWAAFLEGRVNDVGSCCLYGQPINEGADRQRRLLHFADGDPATVQEVARDYLTLDLDGALTPSGLNFLAEPGAAVGAVLDTVAELVGCAFAATISSSAGFKSGVRAKAIVPLHQPMMPSGMRGWAKAVNARLGIKLLDPAVLAPAQPIYFARPIFYGVRDPFPQRVYLRHGKEPIDLVIPPEATNRSKPETTPSASQGGGWRVHLSRIGQLGFHDPLLAAAGAVVRAYYGAPSETIAGAIHAIVREAVLSADAGGRTPNEIARYASRYFWNQAIAHAARRERDARSTTRKRSRPPHCSQRGWHQEGLMPDTNAAFDELFNAAASAETSAGPLHPDYGWPEAEPFNTIRPAKPFPLHALPPTIRSAVTETQLLTQAPVEIVVASAISAASLAAQGHANVGRDSDLVGPIGIYSISIAVSANASQLSIQSCGLVAATRRT
jgi:hypothetical protein